MNTTSHMAQLLAMQGEAPQELIMNQWYDKRLCRLWRVTDVMASMRVGRCTDMDGMQLSLRWAGSSNRVGRVVAWKHSVSWQLQLYMHCLSWHVAAAVVAVLVLPVLAAENLLPGFRVVINDGPDACESYCKHDVTAGAIVWHMECTASTAVEHHSTVPGLYSAQRSHRSGMRKLCTAMPAL